MKASKEFEYLDKRLIAVERQLLEMPMVGLRTPDIEPPLSHCKKCEIALMATIASKPQPPMVGLRTPDIEPPKVCPYCHAVFPACKERLEKMIENTPPDSSLEQVVHNEMDKGVYSADSIAQAIKKWISEKIDAIETYPSIPEKEWVSKYAVKKALLNERGRE